LRTLPRHESKAAGLEEEERDLIKDLKGHSRPAVAWDRHGSPQLPNRVNLARCASKLMLKGLLWPAWHSVRQSRARGRPRGLPRPAFFVRISHRPALRELVRGSCAVREPRTAPTTNHQSVFSHRDENVGQAAGSEGACCEGAGEGPGRGRGRGARAVLSPRRCQTTTPRALGVPTRAAGARQRQRQWNRGTRRPPRRSCGCLNRLAGAGPGGEGSRVHAVMRCCHAGAFRHARAPIASRALLASGSSRGRRALRRRTARPLGRTRHMMATCFWEQDRRWVVPRPGLCGQLTVGAARTQHAFLQHGAGFTHAFQPAGDGHHRHGHPRHHKLHRFQRWLLRVQQLGGGHAVSLVLNRQRSRCRLGGCVTPLPPGRGTARASARSYILCMLLLRAGSREEAAGRR